MKEIKRKGRKTKFFSLIFFLSSITLLYLGCECFFGFEDICYYIYPALINSLTILSAYLAWRSYTKEHVPVIVSILLSGIAVLLPFVGRAHDWFNWDWMENAFAFVWMLWPVPITVLSNYFVHKLSENRKYICGANFLTILFFAAGIYWFAEGAAGKKVWVDLCILAMWIAEGILWTFVLNFSNRPGKRNLMAAWMVCLLLFGCVAITEVRGDYWNKPVFLCSPVLLLFAMEIIKTHIAEDKPYFVQKRSLLFFLIVLPLLYFITDSELIYETGPWRYDIAKGFYLLFLADIMCWKELYRKLVQAGSRLKGAAFMTAINVGVFLFFLIGNRRLLEILSYVRWVLARAFFPGSRLTVSQADWGGYRKAAFKAFLTKNLTTLDSAYGRESYWYPICCGHGLASIRFQYGMLPLLIMLLCLVLVIILLWNWNQNDIFLNQCARYLAVGYILKMSAAFILQANMIVLPYMEFPFSGMDIAEILLPVLLVYESCCRTKDVI